MTFNPLSLVLEVVLAMHAAVQIMRPTQIWAIQFNYV